MSRFPTIEYLAFATRYFGRTTYDLASSGVAAVPAAEFEAADVDDPSAREKFCAALARRYSVPEGEVFPVPGGSGAIYGALATLTMPGDGVLIETPGYQPLLRAAEALGLQAQRFERRFDLGFTLDPAAITGVLSDRVRVVAITNPHNPSGVFVEDAAIRALAETLSTHDIWLFVSEVYRELVTPRTTARNLGSNVVIGSSATKSWGLPWARAGWLFGPAMLSEKLRDMEWLIGGFTPGTWAWGELACKRADDLLERTRSTRAENRERVMRWLEHSEFHHVAPGPGVPFVFLRDAQGRPTRGIIEDGIIGQDLVLAPGEFFGTPTAFRLSWTLPAQRLEEGLRRVVRMFGSAGGATE